MSYQHCEHKRSFIYDRVNSNHANHLLQNDHKFDDRFYTLHLENNCMVLVY